MEKPLELHCIPLGQMQTNCYILIHRDRKEAIVFDPGDQGDVIMETLKKEGAELAGVCLTHAHFDHVMALPYLMEQKEKMPIYNRFHGFIMNWHFLEEVMRWYLAAWYSFSGFCRLY